MSSTEALSSSVAVEQSTKYKISVLCPMSDAFIPSPTLCLRGLECASVTLDLFSSNYSLTIQYGTTTIQFTLSQSSFHAVAKPSVIMNLPLSTPADQKEKIVKVKNGRDFAANVVSTTFWLDHV